MASAVAAEDGPSSTTTLNNTDKKPQPSLFQQALGVVRASYFLSVILGATVTNVTVALAIHLVTRDKKKAQGRCMYSICTIYSWALNLIPWIDIQCKLPPTPIDLDQFILTSNHISFGDLFIIHRCMISSMTRRAIENVRLVYWQKLAEIPIVKGIFTLTGGVPIKILGSTSLKEGDNKYCKESVKQVYASVDKAVAENLSIALSFEGRRNPNPPTLSKIQRGMFKLSHTYNLPCLLIRLKGVETIWPAEGLPTGTGTIECEMLPHGYKWETVEEYEEGLKAVYERGEDGPPPTKGGGVNVNGNGGGKGGAAAAVVEEGKKVVKGLGEEVGKGGDGGDLVEGVQDAISPME